MTHSKSILFTVLTLSIATVHTKEEPKSLNEQVCPSILAKVNIESPSQQDIKLINACHAFHTNGINHQPASSEIFQAITSVNMFEILKKYFATATNAGYIALCKQCALITANIEQLNAQQQRLKFLRQNTNLVKNINQQLGTIKTDEDIFLTLFAPIALDEKTQELEKMLYIFGEKFSENSKVLEFMPRYGQLNTAICALVAIFFAKLASQAKLSNLKLSAMASLYAALTGFSAYQQKQILNYIATKQQHLKHVGKIIQKLESVHALLKSHPKLQQHFAQEYQKLGELFDAKSTEKASDELKDLINTLQSYTQPSMLPLIATSLGKILATHKKLLRLKGQIIPYLEVIGQIDATLAVHKLCNEYQNHPRVKFCLPEFVDAQTPVLEIHEYWHPLINPNLVITNSLNMDHNCANLIITGPNAGGKTTSLMSLIINIIFAQSFGIAPCSSLRMTPFAKIHSYLDITTNLQEGLSLFAAEVDRAKKLKDSILACKDNEKTFTIIDEIFSGTNPQVASDVGFKFAAQLGGMGHSMTIITTHFPALTELEEKNKNFVNFKVADATVHDDGSITYPFKLIRGISTQNVAEQMLINQDLI